MSERSTTLLPMIATVPRSAALTRRPELLPADEKARIAATLLTRVREISWPFSCFKANARRDRSVSQRGLASPLR